MNDSSTGSSDAQPRNRRQSDKLTLNPAQLFDVLLKRFKLIIAVVLLSLVVGGTYVSFQKSRYSATSMIQLNTGERPLLDTQSLLIGSSQDKAAIQSELDILRSPELAQRVIEELKLDTKREFSPLEHDKTELAKLKRQFYAFLDSRKNEDAAQEEDNSEVKRVRIIKAVQDRLELKRDPLSYTVRITFTSEVPERAKNIANAYAEQYLRFQIDNNEKTSREANAWLSKRVEELRGDVLESERAVQAFSEDNNLLELDGQTLDAQQLLERSTELSSARAEFAQAQARLNQAKALLRSGSGIDSVPEVLNSILIQKLREQEAILQREKSELAGHFGPKHPTMENITSELNDLRGKIGSETRKIIGGLENELAVSRARVRSLQNDLDAARGRVGTNSKQDIQLSELKREAEANRTIYQAFLSRLKSSGEAVNLEQANTKIIARAQLPLEPSEPRKALILSLFGFIGVCFGAMMAVLLEYISRGFLTTQQVENILRLQAIGMVPETPRGQNKILADFAAESSSSLYTESLRRILAGMQFSAGATPPRSVLILSALPQEGKGWLASSLARMLAASGKTVLLIDCDLHKRSLGQDFGITHELMLNDYLEGHADIASIIAKDDNTGLDVIGSTPMKNKLQQHLESEEMQALMDFAHANYDMVFVDGLPVIGLSDSLFLSRLVDTSLFVVQWSKTPRQIASNAMRILGRAGVKISGCVLTQVDVAHYKKQEFGNRGFKKYGEYYQESDKTPSKVVKFKA